MSRAYIIKMTFKCYLLQFQRSEELPKHKQLDTRELMTDKQ